MFLGIMSDTHGYLTIMRSVFAKMAEEFNVDTVIHLGDDSTDADELMGSEIDVITVPGIFEERYKDSKIPNRLIKNFNGVPFLITHTPIRDRHDLPNDIDPTEAVANNEVKVVLYGHTHQPEIREKNGAIYINPGHLKPDDKRGSPPSFAIIELNQKKLNIKIIGLDGGILKDKMFLF